MLLMIEAITFLLMTPEGAKLRRETPKCTPPTPPAPKPKSAPHKITIAMPGWHTIAALRPRIDPRVVEREQREALARLIAEADAQATAPPQDHRRRPEPLALPLQHHPLDDAHAGYSSAQDAPRLGHVTR